jgi:hypothetical protein
MDPHREHTTVAKGKVSNFGNKKARPFRKGGKRRLPRKKR